MSRKDIVETFTNLVDVETCIEIVEGRRVEVKYELRKCSNCSSFIRSKEGFYHQLPYKHLRTCLAEGNGARLQKIYEKKIAINEAPTKSKKIPHGSLAGKEFKIDNVVYKWVDVGEGVLMKEKLRTEEGWCIGKGKMKYRQDGEGNYEVKKGTKSIPDLAFADSQMRSIQLPASLKRIGKGAFHNCRGLNSISIPEGVITIGKEAFQKCIRLRTITIPEGVVVVEARAFADCDSLWGVILPETLLSMGNEIFSGCKALKNIRIPPEITQIPSKAFESCKALTTVSIPRTIIEIQDFAFKDCGICEIFLGDSIEKVGKGAFGTCNDLRLVRFPEDADKRKIEVESDSFPISARTILGFTGVDYILPRTRGRSSNNISFIPRTRGRSSDIAYLASFDRKVITRPRYFYREPSSNTARGIHLINKVRKRLEENNDFDIEKERWC